MPWEKKVYGRLKAGNRSLVMTQKLEVCAIIRSVIRTNIN